MKFQFETPQFLLLLFITFLAVITSTAYIFLVKNDYSYVIEGTCDPDTKICYQRDCSEEDACYEYQEEIYTVYEVKAVDFEKCGGLSCAEQCVSGAIPCSEVTCDPEAEECSSQEEYENTEDVESDTELKEEASS